MGLDSSIYKPIGEILNAEQADNEFLGKELICFRKFYALDNWFRENCEVLGHWFVDGCKITRQDLLRLKSELDEKKDDYFFSRYFEEKLAELIKFLENEIDNPSCEYYYYTWVN